MPKNVMGFDKSVLSMRYEILPAESAAETSTEPRPPAEPWRRWYFDVRDNIGAEYEVQSGASGFRGPNQTIFDNDIDFEPSVPPAATWIEIRAGLPLPCCDRSGRTMTGKVPHTIARPKRVCRD